MKLYYNPISSYSQKVLMALHEKEVTFEPHIVNIGDPGARAEFAKVNPFIKVPVLVLPEQDWSIPESSIIIEYLDTHFDSGTRLIPEDKDKARMARFFDRTADLYLNNPMQKIFFDGRKPEASRDPEGVAQARKTLDTAYGLLEKGLSGKQWVLGDDFTMGDVGLTPPLNYLKMVHPFDKHPAISAYHERLVSRPSWQKVWAEAQPMLAKMS